MYYDTVCDIVCIYALCTYLVCVWILYILQHLTFYHHRVVQYHVWGWMTRRESSLFLLLDILIRRLWGLTQLFFDPLPSTQNEHQQKQTHLKTQEWQLTIDDDDYAFNYLVRGSTFAQSSGFYSSFPLFSIFD